VSFTRLEYARMEKICAKEILMTHPFLMSLPLFVNPSLFRRIARKLRGFFVSVFLFRHNVLGIRHS
jgi:hypothetical protein